MKARYILLFMACLFHFHMVQGQDITSFDTYETFENNVIKHNDTCYVLNFWATWCKPCVKELPYFEALTKEIRKNKLKIKVILVSLDFKKQIQSHLIPFLKARNYTSEVLALHDKNYNNWLTKVDNEWSGSIPATLLIYGNKSHFAEKEFDDETDLKSFVYDFIK